LKSLHYLGTENYNNKYIQYTRANSAIIKNAMILQ